MLRVPLKDFEPGLKLALPVFHPYQSTSQLVGAGCGLQDHVIDRLVDLGITDVWVNCPSLQPLEAHVSPDLVLARQQLASVVCRLFEQLLARQNPTALPELMGALGWLTTIFEQSHKPAVYLPCLSMGSDDLVRHAADTAVLSLLLALRLRRYITGARRSIGLGAERAFRQIALGAVLHDLGLYMVPGGPLMPDLGAHRKPSELAEEHVHLGHLAVKDWVETGVATIVRHHHQHFDGSGYPRTTDNQGVTMGLRAEHVPIFVRVVTAADLFDELRLGDGKARSTAAALHQMLSPECRAWIDPVVMQAVTETVLPAPPGTLVRLSNGEQGYVVDYHPENPYTPVVKIVEPGRFAEGDSPLPLYDLMQSPDLSIVEADGEDVSHLLRPAKAS